MPSALPPPHRHLPGGLLTTHRRPGFLARVDIWVALGIFAVLAFAYLQSPVTYVGDSKYCLLLSESLLTRGSFLLDDYAIPRQTPARTGDAEVDGDIYQIELHRGHLYYYFPPGSSILSIPFVWLMDHLGHPIVDGKGVYSFGNETKVQAKLAAWLTALLGVILYATARLKLPAAWSGVVALGTGLGTQLWSTASRAVWTHTWGTLLLGSIVYLLLAHETGRRRLPPVLLATLLSWTYFVRPTNSIFILGVTVYVVLYAREIFAAYALTGAGWFLAFAGWSWLHFGRVLPSYYRASRLGSDHYWEALAGNALSPSRGMFVLVPVALWVAWLVARHWHGLGHRRLLNVLLAAGAGQWLAVSGFSPWNGGTCFGPRYTTELVPTLALAAVLGIAALRRWHRQGRENGENPRTREWQAALAAGAASLLLSTWINWRGANALATVKWNNLPVSIDTVSARVWDWTYPQALAGIVPMPEPEVLPVWDGKLTFGGGAASAYQGDGWAPSDPDHCWTEEPTATIFFATAPDAPNLLRVRMMPFIAVGKKVKRQRVKLDLNGRRIGAFELTQDRTPTEYEVSLPAGLLKKRNLLKLRLPYAVSPRSLGLSSDPRRLGVHVEWMELAGKAEGRR